MKNFTILCHSECLHGEAFSGGGCSGRPVCTTPRRSSSVSIISCIVPSNCKWSSETCMLCCCLLPCFSSRCCFISISSPVSLFSVANLSTKTAKPPITIGQKVINIGHFSSSADLSPSDIDPI